MNKKTLIVLTSILSILFIGFNVYLSYSIMKIKNILDQKPQLLFVNPDGSARALTKEDGKECVVLSVWGGIHCFPSNDKLKK